MRGAIHNEHDVIVKLTHILLQPTIENIIMAHVVVDAVYKFAKQIGDTYYEGITKDPEFTARLETAVRIAGYIIPG